MITAIIILIILNIILYINSHFFQTRISDNSLQLYTSTTVTSSETVYIQLRRIKKITIGTNPNIFVFSFDDLQNIPEKCLHFSYKSSTLKIISRTSHSVTGELIIGSSDNIMSNNKGVSATFLFFA